MGGYGSFGGGYGLPSASEQFREASDRLRRLQATAAGPPPLNDVITVSRGGGTRLHCTELQLGVSAACVFRLFHTCDEAVPLWPAHTGLLCSVTTSCMNADTVVLNDTAAVLLLQGQHYSNLLVTLLLVGFCLCGCLQDERQLNSLMDALAVAEFLATFAAVCGAPNVTLVQLQQAVAWPLDGPELFEVYSSLVKYLLAQWVRADQLFVWYSTTQ